MADQNKKTHSAKSTQADEDNAVTINLGPVLAIVALIVMIPVGFMVGRKLAGQPTTPPTSQGAPVAEQPASGQPPLPDVVSGQAVAVDPNLASNPQVAVESEPEQIAEMAPGQVIPLGEPNHPLIGQPAIEVSGVTLTGEKAKLSDYQGKSVMLNFWATWCPPCRAEMPFMEEAYHKYKEQGLEILAVNAGERVGADQIESTVKSFVDNGGFSFPIMLADDTYGSQARYFVSSLPSTFLVDKDGKVVDTHRGMYPNRATLEDQLVRRFSFKAAAN